MAANLNTIPPPAEMKLSGDVASNWDTFKEDFEDYMLASGLSEKAAKVKAATLRRVMGSECKHIYKHNLHLTAEQEDDVTVILAALEKHFKPVKNVIFERFVFGSQKQEEGELIDAYVTRLREKAATCNYGELKEELIRDRLVLGIADEGTRRRLLREKDLTLASAIDMCRAAELTDARMRALAQKSDDTINAADSRPARNSHKFNKPRTREVAGNCKYCGHQHKAGRDACPAFGKTCRHCGTPNHFASVCLKKQTIQPRLNVVDTAEDTLQDNEQDEAYLYMTSATMTDRQQGKKWFVNLRMDGVRLKCQLDSGATCNVMSLKEKMKVAPNRKLAPSQTRLRLYSGEVMTSLGLFSTNCTIKGHTYQLQFEIVETNQYPLLSGSTCERLGLMHFTIPEELHKVEDIVPGSLTKQQLTSRYDDVFSFPIESLPGEVHFDLNESITPVQCPPRNVPIALKTAVKAELDRHEREGHLISVTEPTDWISNMVIIKKPDKIRICIDPKPLNKALKRSHYIMPTLDDVLYKLPKARIFSLVDAREAFLQCKLDSESSFLTTFWTPWGRKRWLKLPFGVSVAPEVYQRKQHELLTGLDGVEPIADDILIVGCGDSDGEAIRDHDTKLLALMERCRAVRLRLSLKKLQFKVKEVRFHGHVLSAEGLRPDPEKVRAVQAMPPPVDVKGVQRFIGFITYLSKFMPRLSEVCEPLRRLLDKDVPWHWLPTHDAAVAEIKRLVSAAPVLKYYDVNKPVTVQSDASQNGLGCCLLQDGQPVAFASRALTSAEQNYAQIEKECLSIVFACQRFHYYLYGRGDVTAETDHKPLIAIFNKPLLSAPKRLQSMLLTLQGYSLNVVYKPGPEMFLSDTLSRATTPPHSLDQPYIRHSVCTVAQQEWMEAEQVDQTDYLNVTSQRLAQIIQYTETDDHLQALKSTVLEGWPELRGQTPIAVREYWAFRDEISVQNGVLFKSDRVIIPKKLRPEMLRRIHLSHTGAEACYRQARQTLFWPNMQGEIKDFVGQCAVCNEYAHDQQKETMMSHPLPKRPWQIVSMDLFNHAGKDFLLIVDHYSDFWEIEYLPDLSAETTIKRCKAQFARYGQPDRVITDCGPQFDCGLFRQFSLDWGFQHVTSSPRHPKANGKAESAVKIAKNICKRASRAGEDPWRAILLWRNTPTVGMDSSPAQRLMARRLKTPLPVADSLLEPSVVSGVPEKIQSKRQTAKRYYDRSAKDLPKLQVGQGVRMKPLPGDRTGRWRPGVCLQQVAPRSYLVKVEGATYRRNRVDLRPAEQAPPETGVQLEHTTTDRLPKENSIHPQEDQRELTSMPASPPTPRPPAQQTLDRASLSPAQTPVQPVTHTRSGRVTRPPLRLNL